MKRIPLSQGKFATVDDGEFNLINQWKWSFRSDGYAVRRENNKMIRLHRQLTNAPQGMDVDHINGNTLDNRKSNLRICTHRQNIQNQKIRNQITSSKYKGVLHDKRSGKWMARLTLNGKQKRLGLFHCEIAAACMYNAKAKEYFGEYARPNKVA